jgi:hypothetical protein
LAATAELVGPVVAALGLVEDGGGFDALDAGDAGEFVPDGGRRSRGFAGLSVDAADVAFEAEGRMPDWEMWKGGQWIRCWKRAARSSIAISGPWLGFALDGRAPYTCGWGFPMPGWRNRQTRQP